MFSSVSVSELSFRLYFSLARALGDDMSRVVDQVPADDGEPADELQARAERQGETKAAALPRRVWSAPLSGAHARVDETSVAELRVSLMADNDVRGQGGTHDTQEEGRSSFDAIEHGDDAEEAVLARMGCLGRCIRLRCCVPRQPKSLPTEVLWRPIGVGCVERCRALASIPAGRVRAGCTSSVCQRCLRWIGDDLEVTRGFLQVLFVLFLFLAYYFNNLAGTCAVRRASREAARRQPGASQAPARTRR